MEPTDPTMTPLEPAPAQHPSAFSTPAEREAMLAKMHRAKEGFYFMAVQVGDHAFVEFAGMIGEYIKLCEALHKKGFDFAELAQVSKPYHAHYVGEKIGCIYGGALFKDQELMTAFLAGMTGAE